MACLKMRFCVNQDKEEDPLDCEDIFQHKLLVCFKHIFFECWCKLNVSSWTQTAHSVFVVHVWMCHLYVWVCCAFGRIVLKKTFGLLCAFVRLCMFVSPVWSDKSTYCSQTWDFSANRRISADWEVPRVIFEISSNPLRKLYGIFNMWEVFRVKFCELTSRFDLVLTRHILKWRKSVLL